MADLDDTGVAYGGVIRRIVAALLDGVIVTLIMAGIGIALGLGAAFGGAGGLAALTDPGALSEAAAGAAGAQAASKMMWVGLLMMGIVLAYYIVPLALPMRATPGKAILGLAVTDRGHDRIGMGRSLWRYIAMSLTAPFLIPLLLGIFNRERRTLHDMMAGTVVIRRDSAPATIPERSMFGRIGNAVAALLVAAAVALPVFGYVTGFGSSMLEGMNVASRSAGSTERLAGAAKNTAAKRLQPVAGGAAAKGGDIDFGSADRVAERFEDMAVQNQAFPKTPADLKLTSTDYNRYGIRGVAFDPHGAMLLKFAKGQRKATLRMLPSLDSDSGYITWKCSGAPANKLPSICRG